MRFNKKVISYLFLFSFIFPIALDCCWFMECHDEIQIENPVSEIIENCGECCETSSKKKSENIPGNCYCDSDIQIFQPKQNEINTFSISKLTGFLSNSTSDIPSPGVSQKLISLLTLSNFYPTDINILNCSFLI